MVLEVLRHGFTGIETCFDFCMRDVSADDNRAVKAQTSAYRIVGQNSTYIFHRLVEVNPYGISFAGLTQLFGNKRRGVIIQFLNPYTVFVNLTFDVSVRRATYSESDGTAGTVSGKTNNADIMRHIFAAELCAQTNLVRLL